MVGPKIIDNDPRAQQCARAIASDIELYNRDKILKALREDNLFGAMAEEITEGRELYKNRVNPEIFKRNFYDRAVLDLLLKQPGKVDLPIW